MILNREELMARVADGRILFLSDAQPKYSTSSIDVTLGDWAIRYRDDICQAPLRDRPLRLGNKEEVEDAFDAPFKIKSDFGLYLTPGECVLAHTHEFVGGMDDQIVAMIKDRSTLGRYFLTTHTGAGWGDVGYHNRWTLEIKNSSPRPVVLPPRARIAQMVFFEGNPTQLNYEGLGGFYQKGGASLREMSFEEANARWDPRSMLPNTL